MEDSQPLDKNKKVIVAFYLTIQIMSLYLNSDLIQVSFQNHKI